MKVYQKDSYDENVEKPVKNVILREPDTTGNYINNGDFSIAENLSDDKNWKFLTTLDGDGKAEIKCQFCNKTYQFNKEELEKILKRAQNK